MTEPLNPQRQPTAPPRPLHHHPSTETRRDAEAAMAVRRELGPEYEEDLAAGLAERVEQLVAFRTAELRQAGESDHRHESLEATAQKQRFVTAIVSLGAGIPITAIALAQGGLVETAVCWAGIVGINLAQAMNGHRQR